MDKYVSIRLSHETARQFARDLTEKVNRKHRDLTPYHETLDFVITMDDEVGAACLTVEDDGVLVMQQGELVDYDNGSDCVMMEWPTKDHPCYDCGSTIHNHHTPLCDLAPSTSVRNLPQEEGTQWWTGAKPKKAKK